MNRILIDGRFIGIGDSISSYTLELLKGLLKIDKENEYTLLIRPQGEKEVEKYFGKNKGNDWPKNLILHIFDIPHYSLAEQIKLLRYLNKEKFDLVHFTQFNHPVLYRGKYVICIHDLTLVGHLHRQSAAKRLAFKQVISSAAKHSKKIITISDKSKEEIIDYCGVEKNKIAVTYLAVDPKYSIEVRKQSASWRTDISKFKEKYGICGDYLLYTGMWKKHKNILRMLSAFERYIAEIEVEKLNLQLVLIGRIDDKEPEIINEIARMNNSHKYKAACKKVFVTTGFVEEDELPIAYAGAKAYITPSLSEGFGLPPLEAMACGTPVISSNESCMPEVLGKAAYYFDPYNIDEIKKAIEKILNDEKLRKELTEKGILQAAKYNWDNTAKETLEVYNEVLNS